MSSSLLSVSPLLDCNLKTWDCSSCPSSLTLSSSPTLLVLPTFVVILLHQVTVFTVPFLLRIDSFLHLTRDTTFLVFSTHDYISVRIPNHQWPSLLYLSPSSNSTGGGPGYRLDVLSKRLEGIPLPLILNDDEITVRQMYRWPYSILPFDHTNCKMFTLLHRFHCGGWSRPWV